MSHDKIKSAARERMTATGEPYTAARRHDISEHGAARVTSAISPEDVRAAAEVHRELGPDYSDEVVAAFIDKVDQAVSARVDARLADLAASGRAVPATRRPRRLTRRVARDVLAATAGALVAVGAIGLYDVTSAHPGPAVSKIANGACTGKSSNSGPCFMPHSRVGVKAFVVTAGGRVRDVPPGTAPHG